MKNITKALIGIGGLAAVWGGAGYTMVRTSYNYVFAKTSLPKYTTNRTFKEIEERYPGKYTRKPVQFPSGELMLQGYLYGERKERGLVVFSHGIFSGHETYIGGILNLVDRGCLVFGFDNTGCCESPGETSKGLQQGPRDLAAALDFVAADPELSALPRFLFGHSWGGYSVCAVLGMGRQADGVVAISGFSEPVDVTEEMGEGMVGPIARTMKPLIRLENRRRFGEDAGITAVDGINSTETPVLIMHGAGDDYVRYNGAGIINQRERITNPNAEFLTLDYSAERNGHNNSFLSEEAKLYKDRLEERLEVPKKEYHVKESWELPEEVQAEYFRDVDKDISAGVNTELFDTVDAFYQKILAGK